MYTEHITEMVILTACFGNYDKYMSVSRSMKGTTCVCVCVCAVCVLCVYR